MKKTKPCQELPQEVLERLDKMKKDIIEEMIRNCYSRELAEDQAEAFS